MGFENTKFKVDEYQFARYHRLTKELLLGNWVSEDKLFKVDQALAVLT